MIGKTLAHYEITSLIGKGGMGEVYQAKDLKLGRDVAIKVLPEEFAKDADRVARFQREAKLLASLNHPNIASIYGLEELIWGECKILIGWEIPRLCRGGSNSVTDPGVYRDRYPVYVWFQIPDSAVGIGIGVGITIAFEHRSLKTDPDSDPDSENSFSSRLERFPT